MTKVSDRKALVFALAATCTSGFAQTSLVSVSSGGAEGNQATGLHGDIYRTVGIAQDGRHVVFDSLASNLVAGDTDGVSDVFVHDLADGSTIRVSVGPDGTQGNWHSYFGGGVSADGRFIAFETSSTNWPIGANLSKQIYLRDVALGTTVLVSATPSGAAGDLNSRYAVLSADGRYVAFESQADDHVPGDTNGTTDVFVRNMVTGTTTRASVSSGGLQGQMQSFGPSISFDGRYVAFSSEAGNLVPGDAFATTDVFVRDLVAGTTVCASLGSSGSPAGGCSDVAISGDGRHVAFVGPGSLLPGHPLSGSDLYERNLDTGALTRISVDSNGSPGDGGWNVHPSLSFDGRFVAFVSNATNLAPGDDNGMNDVFVHDAFTGTTKHVSVDTGGMPSNGRGESPSITPDGRIVAFVSDASNLVSGDANATWDAFVRDFGVESAFGSYCAGDGLVTPCPCANNGLSGHGCDNSAGTGGGLLAASGTASLAGDTVHFACAGELPSSLSILLQGTSSVAPVPFGDGLRCAGGALKRLYARNASGGIVTMPQGADPSVSARSSALGDPIAFGSTRVYQVYYRDSNLSFCPSPQGDGFNASNAIAATWGM